MNKRVFGLGVMGAMLLLPATALAQSSNFYAGAGYGVVTVPKVDGIKFSDANNGFIQLGYRLTENFSIEGQYSRSAKEAKASLVAEGIDVSEIWWQELVDLDPAWGNGSAQATFPYAFIDLAVNANVDIETTAIYGAYRSSGDLYVKVKAGYLRESSTMTLTPLSFDFYAAVYEPNMPVEFSSQKGDGYFETYVGEASAKLSESESGFSGGLGVGYKFSEHFFSELEYTMMNDDLDYYSLSINYMF